MQSLIDRCATILVSVLHIYHFNSLTWRPGGNDCFSFSAFSVSSTTSVYRKRLQRTWRFYWFFTIFCFANLEFGVLAVLLDLHGLRVLAPGCQQELLDVRDLARHFLLSIVCLSIDLIIMLKMEKINKKMIYKKYWLIETIFNVKNLNWFFFKFKIND